MHDETGGIGPVVPMDLRSSCGRATRRPEGGRGEAAGAVRHDGRKQAGALPRPPCVGPQWMAIRGDSPVQIKLVAGYAAFEMTQE